MFGRHHRLPIDAFFGLPTDTLSESKQSEYVVGMRNRLDKAYKMDESTNDAMIKELEVLPWLLETVSSS